MEITLKDKVGLVTGGARGIGKAICKKLASTGCNIAVVDIDIEGAKKTANELKEMGVEAIAIKADVSDFSSVEGAVKNCVDSLGKVDILVNNAGVTRDTLLIRMKPEDWDFVLNINLKGVFNFTKATIPYMMRQRYGKIINISSIIGLIGNAGQANYSASKAGVIGFTKSVAKELATRNITCNAIAPGFIETEMTKKIPEKLREEMLKMIPMKKYGQPEDVANAVLFLASPMADYITGQVIVVDGGMAM